MIFSRIVGGLGNQLFQTAACLKYRNQREKVIISFLGDIHVPKRINCLNYIFEKPNWLYFDNSNELNIVKKFVAKTNILELKKHKILSPIVREGLFGIPRVQVKVCLWFG